MKEQKIRKILTLVTLLLILNPIIFAKKVNLKPITLLKPQLDRGKLLMQALKERKSSRSFSSKELPLEIISNLLWAASGINRQVSGLRTTPTASNRQEIDIYVALKKGLYLYNPKKKPIRPYYD